MAYFNILPFLVNDKGATAIEYGLIAAAISVAIGLSLFVFGDQLKVVLQTIVTVIADVNANLS